MTDGNGNKTANRAILALALISVLAIVAGVVVAFYHGNVGAVFAIAVGAAGGIVSIVLRIFDKNAG